MTKYDGDNEDDDSDDDSNDEDSDYDGNHTATELLPISDYFSRVSSCRVVVWIQMRARSQSHLPRQPRR